MENKYHNPDNIEAFLSGKMNPEDKMGFESELAKDPLLQSEIILQKDIIESLKANRTAALKQRLNNIEVGVGTSPFSSMSFKIAASVLIPAAIGLGVYNLMDNPQPANNKHEVIQVQHPAELKDGAVEQNQITEESSATEPSQNPVSETNSIQNNKPETIASVKPAKSPKIQGVIAPKLKEFSDPEFQGDVNLNVPQGDIVPATDNVSDLKVVVEPHGDKNFHYKFYSNKLFLFCDFQSKPYEILELNSSKKRRLYLFHDEAFYELKPNKKEYTPLTAIKDPQLIKQLNTIKDK